MDVHDEGTHEPDAGDRLWNESWYLDWTARDGSLGGYVRLGSYPGLDAFWLWACVVGEGRPLVMALDHTLPAAPGPSIAANGVRADYVVEDPFEAVRVTMSAPARVVGDPAADPASGSPVTLGCDLVWETAGGVYPYPGVSRYEVPARVAGTVTVGDEVILVNGPGERDHSWGHRDWWAFGWVWTSGRLDDGTAFHATRVRVEGLDYAPGFVVPPEGPLRQAEGFAPEEDLGPNGLPATGRMVLDGMDLAVEALHHAPVAMTAPDGRTGRLARAVCRFEARDGRAGYGWTEWNQPPGVD
jgi:hypothetical protein